MTTSRSQGLQVLGSKPKLHSFHDTKCTGRVPGHVMQSEHRQIPQSARDSESVHLFTQQFCVKGGRNLSSVTWYVSPPPGGRALRVASASCADPNPTPKPSTRCPLLTSPHSRQPGALLLCALFLGAPQAALCLLVYLNMNIVDSEVFSYSI